MISLSWPGQIDIHFDLDNSFTDIHKYLRLLEEAVLKTAEYGIRGSRLAGETGVWLDVGKPTVRKICALGVRSSRCYYAWFAFNVNTDPLTKILSPCGMQISR